MFQQQIGLLTTAIFLAVLSFVSYLWKKDKWALSLLFFTALVLRLYISHLDPFLHDWDERFHALVARNMMDDPFKPILYPRTLLPYDFHAWTENYIWLHKQPLFLWQMALSMKIFGVSEYAIRYPSAFMGAVMVVFLYRITWKLTNDRLLSYTSALLMCFSNYQLELTSGFIGMDHNDVTFGFYVLASIWAYVESLHRKGAQWILLVGVFAGCAVLNKWLTGLLVFAGWGINIALSIRQPGSKKEIFRLLLAFVVCLMVFVPWQIYILQKFPLEAGTEFSYNSKHVFEAVENHGGGYLFYFNKFPQYYGLFTWELVIPGFLIFAFANTVHNKVKTVLAACFIFVFLFFSLIVKTKMQSYLFVVAPIGFIFMSYSLVSIVRWLNAPEKWQSLITYAGIIICTGFLFNYAGITNFFHNVNDAERNVKIKNTEVYKSLGKQLQPHTRYVLNLSQHSEVELMFYNKGLVAYHGNLDESHVRLLVQAGEKTAIFRDHSKYTDARYVSRSPLFYLLDVGLEN